MRRRSLWKQQASIRAIGQPDEASRAPAGDVGARSPEAGRQHAEFADVRARGVTRTHARAARPQPGERVLELAVRPGRGRHSPPPGASAPTARSSSPTSLPEMTAIARGAGRGARARNVSTRVLDLEQIDEPDASYDVVLCREGLMLVPDPARAAREILRVLRPGGPGRARRLGAARAEPVARPRVRHGERPDRRSAPAGRAPRPCSRSGIATDLPACWQGRGSPGSRWRSFPTPYRAGSVEEWWTERWRSQARSPRGWPRFPNPRGRRCSFAPGSLSAPTRLSPRGSSSRVSL